MTQKQAIQLFEDRKVRTVWDERTETWYFSVLDVISALTDTVNPTDYFKKMRKRDEALASFVGTNCPQIAMRSETGVMRKTLAGDVKTVLRIIQSIPSQKAEPFKQWMAQVASDRLDQMQDPELSIEQAVADYKRLGYSDTWINQRLKSIEVRKLLTDEWKRGGVDGTQYATLTDIITKEWAGRTTKAYKRYKGLKKENLRDNMTNVELLLNSLAEASATELSRNENPIIKYNRECKICVWRLGYIYPFAVTLYGNSLPCAIKILNVELERFLLILFAPHKSNCTNNSHQK